MGRIGVLFLVLARSREGRGRGRRQRNDCRVAAGGQDGGGRLKGESRFCYFCVVVFGVAVVDDAVLFFLGVYLRFLAAVVAVVGTVVVGMQVGVL